jgi:lipopolysaccharide biosynthesis regulator YciM
LDASSFLFGFGLVASAGVVLYAISRGDPRATGTPDHYRAALGHLTTNDVDAALDNLRRTVQSPHAPPDAYIKLGDLLRTRGEPMAALRVHQGLTVRQDLQPAERQATLRALVEDHRALGQHAEALKVLEQLAAQRRDTGVLRELARQSVLAGDADGAATVLREAQRLDPSLGRGEIAAFLAAAAEQFLQRDRPADAKRLLQQALQSDDNAPLALELSGDLAAAAGDHESALYYWQKLVFAGAPPDSGVHEKLEQVYFETGRFGDLERVYAQVLDKHPRDLGTLLAAARIAIKKGEADDAERLLRAALDTAPGSRPAFELLAGLWLDEGKNREVRDLVATHVVQCTPPPGFVCGQCAQRAERRLGFCFACGRFGDYRPA